MCTSISQGKILAKFLPEETSDLFYSDEAGTIEFGNYKDFSYKRENVVLLWSLNALIDILPLCENVYSEDGIDIVKFGRKIDFTKEVTFNKVEYSDFENGILISIKESNSISAVYNLINSLRKEVRKSKIRGILGRYKNLFKCARK
jgi:hypothetical protein